MPVLLHEESPDELREAIRFTAAETGFLPRLIEKDYFCTVLLEHIMAADPDLVFKGGTCLAKVHAGFYRLSEDLDFAVPMAADVSRAQRSRSSRCWSGSSRCRVTIRPMSPRNDWPFCAASSNRV